MNSLVRLVVFGIGVVVVAFMIFNVKVWQDDFIGYFLKAGRWTELVFVFLIGYLILHGFEFLLKLQARVSK